MTRWYRAYAGTVKDDKLAEVSVIAGCSRSVAIAVWHAILESAAETDDGGRFETTPRRVAAALCEPLAAIQSVFEAMTEIAMIGADSVTAWKSRQYESDKSTERSRKHRETKRNGDATLQGRCATPPEAETETDTDSKEQEDTASAASSSPRAPVLDLDDAERRCGEACGSNRLGSFSPIAELLHRQADLELDILPVMRARPASGGKVSSWKFYVPIIAEAMLKRAPAAPVASTGPPKIHVMKDTPAWDAWVKFEGKAHPEDAKGGWLFPSRFPPEHKERERAA